MKLDRMLPLLLVAAVSFAEGQPGAVASHEVPAGTRTVQPLAGDFPVGRWECWFEASNFADITTSTTAIVPLRCHVSLHVNASVAELLPGGYGWMLGIKSPDAQSAEFDAATAFTVAGSGNLYSRAAEIRWFLEPVRDWKSCYDATAIGCLVIQRTRNDVMARLDGIDTRLDGLGEQIAPTEARLTDLINKRYVDALARAARGDMTARQVMAR